MNQKYHELSSGLKLPMIGLGTFLMTEQSIIWQSLDDALSVGYRLIDTALMYGNEEEIGKALKKLLPRHHLSREDIFLISKLPSTNHGDGAVESLRESIKLLQCEYLDLYLIHWPGSPDFDPDDPRNQILRDKSWFRLVEAKHCGLVKSIGVANYNIPQLQGLLDNDHGERPVVNQIEWHPHWHQDNMKEFCDRNGILLQSYFMFGESDRSALFGDPTIVSVAEKIGRNVSQVLLQWSIQQNIAVLPRSTFPQHLRANMDLDFVIPEEDMKILSSLPQKRYGSDPNGVV